MCNSHRLARLLGAIALLVAGACGRQASGNELTPAERAAIAREIEAKVRSAYDVTQPRMDERMLALYVDTGRVVSASVGHVVTSRDTLAAGIHEFWHNVGMNMRQPKWIWTATYVDVLSPTAAVFTGTYHVPHLTPRGEAHDIGGAMTLVFVKRDSKWGIVQEHLSDVQR